MNKIQTLSFEPWSRGCLQVYTGHGKGKTTASLGLALRAAGHGLKTFVGQFMKGISYGEVPALELLKDYITIEQFGSPDCIAFKESPATKDVALAAKGLQKTREAMLSGEYQLIILDEINVSVYFKLIKEQELLDFVAERPEQVEVICTGRYAPQSLMDIADLVTKMTEVKHPYTEQGILARDGIER